MPFIAQNDAIYRAALHKGLADELYEKGYRRSVLLVSGRFAVLDDGKGFSLAPWKPVLEQRLGQSMTAVVRGGGVTWTFGRQRGPAVGG